MHNRRRTTGPHFRVWCHILAIALGAGSLSGCALVSTESPFWATAAAIWPQAEKPPVTRAHADALPYASSLMWFDGAEAAFVVLGEVRSHGALVWYTSQRQAIVTDGPFVVQTAGMEKNLTKLRFMAPHRVDLRQPVSDTSRMVDIAEARLFNVEMTCSSSPAGQETITILEREQTALKVDESCRWPNGMKVRNAYWIDAATGRPWKIRQHLLPDLPAFNVEILKPAG